MKKTSILLVVILVLLVSAGCSKDTLEYDMNLGYDLNNVKHKDITFNVYHSNTEDNSWEQIASFPCSPQPGHYNDVKLEYKPGQITAVLNDNTYTKSEDGNSVTYDGTMEANYEFKIDGFKGSLPGWKCFDIKDIEGEQLVRLYPISNSGAVSFLGDIRLDKPYDIEQETDTIDNILITIVMK